MSETTDWKARQSAEVYRPLIDAAILRMVQAAGGDVDDAKERLASASAPHGQWSYLTAAMQAVGALGATEALRAAEPYGEALRLFEGRYGEHLEASWCVDSEEDVDPEEWERPVVLEYYPEESHAFLRQEWYVGGSDADVIGLWQRGDRTSLCHAHMEGFWIKGEDVADFAERLAARVEEKLC